MTKIWIHYISICIFSFFAVVFCQPALSAKDLVSVKSEKTGTGYRLLATNSEFIPCTLTISFSRLSNLRSSQRLPYTVAIPPLAKNVVVLDLTPRRRGVSYGFNYEFLTSPGDYLNARHDDSYLYTLPYKHGVKYLLSQGYFGKFSHFKPGSEYALDFTMPEGSEICAARGGIVYSVKEDSSIGGPSEYFTKYGNYVSVYHDDGSIAQYVHLKENGALVEPGDWVKAGQVIGLSGKTGRAQGPHLHFAVQMPTKDGSNKYIPIKFLATDGSGLSLQEGNTYYSNHRGGKAFNEVYGREISNDTYHCYSKTVKNSGKVSIREEKIDTTVLFFIQNGRNKAQEVTFHFTALTNMSASKRLPLTVKVPPLTEKFMFLLRAQNGKAYGYRYSFNYKRSLSLNNGL